MDDLILPYIKWNGMNEVDGCIYMWNDEIRRKWKWINVKRIKTPKTIYSSNEKDEEKEEWKEEKFCWRKHMEWMKMKCRQSTFQGERERERE